MSRLTQILILIILLLSSHSYAQLRLCRKVWTSQTGDMVFHASATPNLKAISPNISTHGESWVYATTREGIVASYLANWSDLDFYQAITSAGHPVLVERYAGAFKKIYEGQKGSIYSVAADGFISGKTSFSGEVVYPKTVEVLNERVIQNALDYLYELHKNGELKLYTYPNRPPEVPKDDADLVFKLNKWIRRNPNGTLYSRFVAQHPHLKARLDEALAQP